MTTIQVRIDPKVKQSAKRVLDTLGMDMSTAVKLYFRQIVLRKGLPFLVLTENGFTPAQEEQVLRASREAHAGKNVSRVMTPKQMLAYLQKL